MEDSPPAKKRSRKGKEAVSRAEKETAQFRASANLWTDEQRAELDSGVMAFFYGKKSRARTSTNRR
jgi:hypothetical protein